MPWFLHWHHHEKGKVATSQTSAGAAVEIPAGATHVTLSEDPSAEPAIASFSAPKPAESIDLDVAEAQVAELKAQDEASEAASTEPAPEAGTEAATEAKEPEAAEPAAL